MCAAQHDCPDVVQSLLSINGIKLSTEISSVFHLAAMKGQARNLALFLRGRGLHHMNEVDTNKSVPLHYAAQYGHSQCVGMFLSGPGVDVNAVDRLARTPLICAAQNNHPDVVSILVHFPGIDLNAMDSSSFTALHYACIRGYEEIARILLGQKGIDIDIKDKVPFSFIISKLHFNTPWKMASRLSLPCSSPCIYQLLICDTHQVKQLLNETGYNNSPSYAFTKSTFSIYPVHSKLTNSLTHWHAKVNP